MRKISDLILISDVDGTLLPERKPLPTRNIEALERFVAKGGKFCIATGRSREMAERFVKSLPVNAPCALYNGGVLYDYSAEKFIMRNYLHDEAIDYLKKIKKDMPEIPAMVITDANFYDVNREIAFSGLYVGNEKYHRNTEIDELKPPWYKILFSVTPEQSELFDTYIKSSKFTGVRFIHSSSILIEMLPETSSKGNALKSLIEFLGVPAENVAAIGDYYNDIEMLEFAPISAATAEAPEMVKAAAKMVVGKCENGAVADLIEYLESIAE